MSQNLLFSMIAEAGHTVPHGNGADFTGFGTRTFVNEVANGLQAYRITGFGGGYYLPVSVSLNASTDRAIYIALKFRASAMAGSTNRLFGVSASSSDLTLGSSVGINASGLLCPSGGGSMLCTQALAYNDGTWYTVVYKVEFRAASNQDIGRMWYEPDGSGVDTPNVSSSATTRTDSTGTHVFLTAVESVTMHYRAALVLEATDLASELTNAQVRAMANDLEGFIASLSGGGAAALEASGGGIASGAADLTVPAGAELAASGGGVASGDAALTVGAGTATISFADVELCDLAEQPLTASDLIIDILSCTTGEKVATSNPHTCTAGVRASLTGVSAGTYMAITYGPDRAAGAYSIVRRVAS